MKTVTIIGSGLAGTLLALYMARRGYEVSLFESRPDMRRSEIDTGRSINLALSCRGITGLAGVGLMPEVSQIMVPMRARAIHLQDGEIKYQSFGRTPEEHINAILRNELNAILLNRAEQEPGIRLHFDRKLEGVDVPHKRLHFICKDGKKYTTPYGILIGADGAASIVRETLVKGKYIKASRHFLNHGYKELSISRQQGKQFVAEHLHIWPRNAFMLLGNPNRDQSITGTLFLPKEGKNSFAELDNEESIRLFFKEKFSDAYLAMPDLMQEFRENPVGHMSTIHCSPWYYKDCLLIGDAAHGLVPFFGQGMNSAFEDCRILNALLEEYKDNWEEAMPAFYQARKANTDAVAKMSMDNFYEIQTGISHEQFNLKKQIEQQLMHRYPARYVSKHVLVMFSNTPYATAYAIGELQNELVDEIGKNTQSIESVNWPYVDKLMDSYDKKLANLDKKGKAH
ncbi:MAG: NAD(P)/FAD-dependent oxidoreductase [Tatlockia sp.]